MVYMVTKTPEQAPDAPEYVTIDFEKGFPIKSMVPNMTPLP